MSSRGASRAGVLGLLAGVVLIAVAASLALGSRWLGRGAVLDALVHPRGTDADVIVRSLRLPRTVVALVVGCCLGVAGALMQGHTRNALAEPGVFGVSAGAALAVVIGLQTGVAGSVTAMVWCALGGALVATYVVQRLAVLPF